MARKKTSCSGSARKVTAGNLWVPAVNNAAIWARCAFVEIDDPWNAKTAIKRSMATNSGQTV